MTADGTGTGSGGLERIVRTLSADARVAAEGLAVELRNDFAEVRGDDDASVLVVHVDDLANEPLAPRLRALADGSAALLLIGHPPDGLLDALPSGIAVGIQDDGCGADALFLSVHGLLERVRLAQHDARRMERLERYRYELGELVEIARALSQERDIERLLDLILGKSRFITGADAGSIYVLEGQSADPTDRQLRFKLSHNESCEFESSEFTMPVSTRSIAGAAVVTRKPISIPDVYEMPEDTPYGFDRSFDERVGYRTKSVIAVPMISAEDDVIGVIQLINKKRHPEARLTPDNVESEVVPFGERGEETLQTLASQAGIALENALLYDEIRRIFEGFVRASVQAIEQRDPTTSGHSLRVSVLSCGLAEVVDRVDSGPYARAGFSRREIKELEYASLLHDFGKIGVREKVLVKAKKLYPHELDAVRARFELELKNAESRGLKRKIELLERGASKEELEALDDELLQRRWQLQGMLQVILQANEPTVLNEGDFTRISEIGELTYVDAQGQERPLLTPDEVGSLQVTRGSLNSQEIDEIRSHVVHTFDFLSKIPWGKTMSNIPEIAGAHHEKLDGSGYPEGVTSEEIPLQSKIMTIADIYDALTARDRPYKKAMPVERALTILGYEVKDGHVDPELVRLFTEAKVFEQAQQDLQY